ncbi:MAG: hypothetical protein JNJ48_01025 [Phycisphaerae bacterium]|nr:hypothetical protein [Phycisphaerae bacterium]
MRRSPIAIVMCVPCLLLAACGGPERSVGSLSEPREIRSEGPRALAVGDAVGQMVYGTRSARVARGSYLGAPIATVPTDGR